MFVIKEKDTHVKGVNWGQVLEGCDQRQSFQEHTGATTRNNWM